MADFNFISDMIYVALKLLEIIFRCNNDHDTLLCVALHLKIRHYLKHRPTTIYEYFHTILIKITKKIIGFSFIDNIVVEIKSIVSCNNVL